MTVGVINSPLLTRVELEKSLAPADKMFIDMLGVSEIPQTPNDCPEWFSIGPEMTSMIRKAVDKSTDSRERSFTVKVNKEGNLEQGHMYAGMKTRARWRDTLILLFRLSEDRHNNPTTDLIYRLGANTGILDSFRLAFQQDIRSIVNPSSRWLAHIHIHPGPTFFGQSIADAAAAISDNRRSANLWFQATDDGVSGFATTEQTKLKLAQLKPLGIKGIEDIYCEVYRQAEEISKRPGSLYLDEMAALAEKFGLAFYVGRTNPSHDWPDDLWLQRVRPNDFGNQVGHQHRRLN